MRRDDLGGGIRETLKRYPPPYENHHGVVPPAPPALVSVAGVSELHAQAMAAIEKADALIAALPQPALVTRTLVRQEAVVSSRIEGTHSTLDELLEYEVTEDSRAAGPDVKVVRGYAVALEEMLPIVKRDGRAAFSIDLVRRLHRAIMECDDDYQDDPGELRQRVVWIGGARDIAESTYNPPPPDDVPACLADQIRFLNCEGMEQHMSLPTRMAIAHAHFEAIHPFRDGNGRAGRLLLPMMMVAEGHEPLYLAGYCEQNRSAYYGALKAAQQRLEWRPVLEFMFEGICVATHEALATRNALRRLPDIWRARYTYRKGAAATRALEFLVGYPIITIDRLSKLLGVSFNAANRGIGQLIERGVLIERTGHKRHRVFAAPEVLRIINRPFGAEPLMPGDEA